MKPPRSQQEAEAPTVVFWDIDRCPVPPSVDPRQVGPCIERFLKRLGYSGRLIITAVGILTKVVPDSVLRKVSSTGIFLHHAHDSYMSMEVLLYCLSCDVNPPANIMVISTPPYYSDKLKSLPRALLRGFNVIYPYPYDFPQELSSINSLWRNFLSEGVCLSSSSLAVLLNSAAQLATIFFPTTSWPPPEEVKCSKTAEWWHNVTYRVRSRNPSTGSPWSCLLRADSWPPLKEGTMGEWVCMVCNDHGGLGAGSLISHLTSREHAYELLHLQRSGFPKRGHGLPIIVETPLYYFPDTAVSTMDASILIMKDPEASEKDISIEEALAKLGSMTEEADKCRKIAENAKEQLGAAQVTITELEAEVRRLKVECDQWRKAAEVASNMLAGGNNNGKYVE